MTKFLGLIETIALLFLGALVSFLIAWYWIIRGAKVKAAEKLAEATEKLENRVMELEGKLNLLNQTVVPLSTAFQNMLIEKLTHYHKPELDALMKKIGPPNTLTADEEILLAEGLKERTKDMGAEISARERTMAEVLPLVIKLAKEDVSELNSAGATVLKIVAVAPMVKQ